MVDMMTEKLLHFISTDIYGTLADQALCSVGAGRQTVTRGNETWSLLVRSTGGLPLPRTCPHSPALPSWTGSTALCTVPRSPDCGSSSTWSKLSHPWLLPEVGSLFHQNMVVILYLCVTSDVSFWISTRPIFFKWHLHWDIIQLSRIHLFKIQDSVVLTWSPGCTTFSII
jgi:hypothetical protein